MIQLKSRAFAAVLALGLATTATAAQAQTVSGFGAKAHIYSNGGQQDVGTEGGAGVSSASKSYSYENGNQWTGLAAASLAGGSLHSASLVSVPNCPSRGCDGVYLGSTAAMWDTVSFVDGEGKNLEIISLMPTSLKIDGILSGQSPQAKYRTYFGYDLEIDPNTLEWIDLTGENLEVLDNLVLPLGDAKMFIYVELWTTAATNGGISPYSRADFGNTLAFDWELPEGVVAQSQSGVFLSGVTSAVPEPGAWALMIAGFGLVGAAIRRRNIALAA